MNALLLFCQCDSIVTKACGALIPVVQETFEAGTNCYDAAIAISICVAIVIVALIAKCVILSWKNKENEANKNEREFKKNKEEEEAKRKQKGDLLDKYLDYLKTQATVHNQYLNKDEYFKKCQTIYNKLFEILKMPDIYPMLVTELTEKSQMMEQSKESGQSQETNKPQEAKKTTESEKRQDTEKSQITSKTQKVEDSSQSKKMDLLKTLNDELITNTLKCEIINNPNSEKYKSVLAYLIQLSQKDELNKFSVEELKKILTDNNLTDENQNT